MRLRKELYLSYRIQEDAFVGRSDKLSEFQTKLYSYDGSYKLAFIVSGRKGVGRRKFIKECVKQKQGSEPFFFNIQLDSKSSIEDFIVFLNQQTLYYDVATLTEKLKGTQEEKTACAVEILKQLADEHCLVKIYDEKGIIRQDKDMADWFESILHHPDYPQQLLLYIISDFKPSTYIETKHPEILHINLKPLTRQECKILFYRYMDGFDIPTNHVPGNDVDDFIDKLNASPDLIFNVVECIHEHTLREAKRDIGALIEKGDKSMRAITNSLFANPDMKDLVVLLSQYEFLSLSVLQEIFSDRLEQFESDFDELLIRSLLTTFGPGEQYIKLDSAVADYIRRAKLSLSIDLKDHVEEVVSNHIDKNGTLTEDLSVYLYEIKKKLLFGKTVDQDLLMPSVAIRAIITLYDEREWSSVVEMCNKILKESYHQNMFPQAVREVRYWLCLAMCRLKDESVFKEIQNSDFEDYDKEFLTGFYFRQTKQFERTIKHFRNVLEHSPYSNKASRELVTSLLALRKYEEALEHAKTNYENGKDNPYHIHAYYRCLVKRHNLKASERETIDSLLSQMEDLQHHKAKSFLKSMKLEYNLRINKSYDRASLLKDANKAKTEFSDSMAVQRTVNEIFVMQGIEENKNFEEEEYE